MIEALFYILGVISGCFLWPRFMAYIEKHFDEGGPVASLNLNADKMYRMPPPIIKRFEGDEQAEQEQLVTQMGAMRERARHDDEPAERRNLFAMVGDELEPIKTDEIGRLQIDEPKNEIKDLLSNPDDDTVTPKLSIDIIETHGKKLLIDLWGAKMQVKIYSKELERKVTKEIKTDKGKIKNVKEVLRPRIVFDGVDYYRSKGKIAPVPVFVEQEVVGVADIEIKEDVIFATLKPAVTQDQEAALKLEHKTRDVTEHVKALLDEHKKLFKGRYPRPRLTNKYSKTPKDGVYTNTVVTGVMLTKQKPNDPTIKPL